jgi:hypothetical protein
MGYALDFGVDMHSLVWVKGVDECIATTIVGIVEKMARILGLVLLQCANTDLHDAVVEGVGVLVPSGLEVLLDGLPHFAPCQCTNVAVGIRRVALVEFDTRIERWPHRIGYAAGEHTLLIEICGLGLLQSFGDGIGRS